MEIFPITSIANKNEEKILRRKTTPVDFDKHPKRELRALVQKMRRTMKAASGVGLAANQVGLPYRLFVAEYEGKFYAVFNPKLEKRTENETETLEEGCLSVPGLFGMVPRATQVTVSGQTIDGKSLKIRARGYLARIFQHEVDHLDGKLYIDRAKEIYAPK